MTTPGEAGQRSATLRLAAIGLLGLGVAAAIFAYGRLASPTYPFSLLGTDPLPVKSALASIALGLAAVQVVLALWIYSKLPLVGRAPRSVGKTHRIVGGVLFLVTAPVALHCLIAYGVQFGTLRVAIHSIAGCFFYGAFAAKVLLVQSKRLPGWALPVAGGILAIGIAVLWYTSALWYYNGFQLP